MTTTPASPPSGPVLHPELTVLPVVQRREEPTAPGAPLRTLIDEFLDEQARTTAVQRFAQRHADASEHVQRRWYADLLPATPPGDGQQYAFRVDLDACSGCKACVTACGALNGLDPGETWRAVGELVGTGEQPLVQPVTTACHHCVEPGCLQGCPAEAYVKDPVTGAVLHLDDSCIGCQYCTLMCPYEVPKYVAELGIVRKCDLCHDRLKADEAPACVQGCPTNAISIEVVDVATFSSGRDFPFAAPDATVTAPTTTYVTTRDLVADVEPVDLRAVRPGHAHLPLTVMLVVTQLAVGGVAVLTGLTAAGVLPDRAGDLGVVASVGLGLLALAGSVAHLGRPQLAWRAVLGLRHSWLSREIVAFGVFAGLAVTAAAARVGPAGLPTEALSWAAVGAGLGGVACSCLVYAVTGRRLWRLQRTVPRFLATAASGGASLTALVVVAGGAGTSAAAPAGEIAFVGVVLALGMDLALLRHRRRGPADALGRTAALLTGPLRGALQARVGLGLLALGSLGVTVDAARHGLTVVTALFSTVALFAVVISELLERWWFFTAEAATSMPGART